MLAAASAPLALAHAFFDHASPPVGSTVDRAPDRVTLHFSQDLEPAFSSVQVFDATGHEVDRNDTKADGPSLAVSVPALAPGRYRVKWRVLSTDTHVTEGDFAFEVRAPAR
jgi:methionine-rich copper-binding protein CopC